MPENAPDNRDSDIWWRPAVLLFFQMSAWIGIPVIIGLFVGRWLDERYGTEPWLFLGITGLAFIVSLVGMIRESKKAMESFDTPKGIDRHLEKQNNNEQFNSHRRSDDSN